MAVTSTIAGAGARAGAVPVGGEGERGSPLSPGGSGELTLYADLSPTTVSTVYPDNLAAVYTAPRRPDGRHWVRGSPLWVAGGYRGPDGGTDLHFRKK